MEDSKRANYVVINDSMIQETIALTRTSTLMRVFDFEAERVSEVTQTVGRSSSYEDMSGAGGSGLSYSFNEVGERKIDRMYEMFVHLCKYNEIEPVEYDIPAWRKKKGAALKIGEA